MSAPVVPKLKGPGLLVPDHIINAPMRLPCETSGESSTETKEYSEQPKKVPMSFPRPVRSDVQESPKVFPPPRRTEETPKEPMKSPLRFPPPRRAEVEEKSKEPPKKAPSSFPPPRRTEVQETPKEPMKTPLRFPPPWRTEVEEVSKEQPKKAPFFPPPRRTESPETSKEKTAVTKIPKTPESESSTKKNGTLSLISKGKLDDVVMYKLLVELFKNIENESGIDFFVESLFHNMLSNAVNAISVSKYVFLLSHLPRKGLMLRSSFFKFLQKHYNERNLILMSQGEDCFRNFVQFFTAAVHHNRDPSLSPFDDLVFGLLDLAEMFSSYLESPEDLKLFCVILVRFSQYEKLPQTAITQKTIEKYWKLKDIVRKKMLNHTDRESTGFIWLMIALDDFSRSMVADFYTNNINPNELTPILKAAYTITFPISDLELYKSMESMRPYLNLI